MKFLVGAYLDMDTPVSLTEGLFAHGRVPKGVLLHQVVRVLGRRVDGTTLHAAFLVAVEDEDHIDLVLEGIVDLYDWEVRNTSLVREGVDEANAFAGFVEEEEAALDDEDDEDDEDEEDEESDDEVEEDDDE